MTVGLIFVWYPGVTSKAKRWIATALYPLGLAVLYLVYYLPLQNGKSSARSQARTRASHCGTITQEKPPDIQDRLLIFRAGKPHYAKHLRTQ